MCQIKKNVISLCLSIVICLHVSIALADIVLTPNYDFQQMKFLDYMKPINTLECNISGDPNSDHVMKWLKNDKPIDSSEGRIEIKGNKLMIRKAQDNDVANYTCILVNQKNPEHPIVSQIISTVGKPTAKLFPSVTVIEGEKLKLECIVSGKPAPIVEWRYEDENKVKTQLDRNTDRIKLTDHNEKGIVNAFLEIDEARMSDRGAYFCSAHNVVNDHINATEASTFVRVKDKLAALWPFIGICAEVVVLCAIIFVYERKRNRTELEESDTDQSPEQKNTPDHGKESVRQRK